MGLARAFTRLFTWWQGQTYNTQVFTALRGVRVGEDDQGNVYYRTRDDRHRWVIYNGEAEGSRVNPDWHGWLHRTWDEPPTERPLLHQPWQKPHLPNLTGTPEAYAPAGAIVHGQPLRRADYEAWSPE